MRMPARPLTAFLAAALACSAALATPRVRTARSWIAPAGLATLQIRANGTLWGWGFNPDGQLGIGDPMAHTDDFGSPIVNDPIQVGTDNHWLAVSMSGDHALALKVDGTLWAWGNNDDGELGLGDYNGRNVPTQVGTGRNWVAIAAGSANEGTSQSFSLALKSDGTLWSWGSNADGALGANNTDLTAKRNAPAQVGTSRWKAVYANLSHALAVKEDGTLWAWGHNNEGQLGVGDMTRRLQPTQVGTDNHWTKVGAGRFHTLGLKTDGTLWSWGSNRNGDGAGQLGIGSTDGSVTKTGPVQVGTGNKWVEVSAGDGKSYAIEATGWLYGWGYHCGNGDPMVAGDVTASPTRLTYTDNSNFSDHYFMAVAGANEHVVGLTYDGHTVVWGFASGGRAGLGASNNSGEIYEPVFQDYYFLP